MVRAGATRVRHPRAGLLALLALLTLAASGACAASGRSGSTAGSCRVPGAQRDWIQGSLAGWDRVRTEALRLPSAPAPVLIFFDRQCTYTYAPRRGDSVHARAADARRQADAVVLGADTLDLAARPHAGVIGLPNGLSIPARPETFASLLPGDTATFLVMSLEDVWRTHPSTRNDTEDWSAYLRRVLAHEMVHSRHLVVWAPRLRLAGGRVGLVDVDDDIIQQTFDTVSGFSASVERETRLLYDAAFSGGAQRRRLVREAIQHMLARRAAAYGGADAAWAEIEQLLLDMEGSAQWAALASMGYAHPYRSARSLVATLRGSRTFWSQDQGLALYLVLDALSPGWQQQVFSSNPRSSLELLREALAR